MNCTCSRPNSSVTQPSCCQKNQAYHDRSAATAGREVTATGMQNMMASAPAAKGNVAFWRMRLETAALLENYELA